MASCPPFVLAHGASVAGCVTSESLYNSCPWSDGSLGGDLICRTALLVAAIWVVCLSMAVAGGVAGRRVMTVASKL